MQKKCGTCDTIKPLSDFHDSARSKDGKTSRCKPCAINAARDSYERLKRERSPDIDLVREQRERIAAARAAGSTHYVSLFPCPAGHIGARYTSSHTCKQCGTDRRRANSDTQARVEKKRSAVKRQTARKLGEKHYQGQSCKNGHDGRRLVSTRQCVECLAARPQPRPAVPTPEAKRRRQARRRTRGGRTKQRLYQATVLMKRPEYLLSRFMYACLRRVLLGAGTTKRSRTVELLGYTHEQLKAHIESLFQPGMTWENYGAWHIDHVKSISAFLIEGVEDPAAVNALKNLQPLWATENLRKSGPRRGPVSRTPVEAREEQQPAFV